MKQKIPVLFYSSLERNIIRKFLLNCNLDDFIVEGDAFLLYKKIVNFIKKSSSKN